MTDHDDARIRLHEDIPLFRESIAFTAAKTGFNQQVIEKDYFCTVLLEDLTNHGGPGLVFKGGTCLAKVHAGFYRLSEDLDFAIQIRNAASRSERGNAAKAIKHAVARVSRRLPGFTCHTELRGANDSSQYNGVLTYHSLITETAEPILIDVSVREPFLTPPVKLSARTVLLDPIDGRPAIPGLDVICITVMEAMAEKFRAALSRRDIAIRDYYDLDHALRHLSLDFGSPTFVEMVRQKLAVPGNPPVDVGIERLADLRRQLDTKLKPVLRQQQFRDFHLDRSISLVVDMAARVS